MTLFNSQNLDKEIKLLENEPDQKVKLFFNKNYIFLISFVALQKYQELWL